MTMASLLAAAASAAGDAAKQESGGLPQLNVETFPSQIFWLIVALAVLYLLMSRIALPRIASVLEERADAIQDDHDAAAEYRRKAGEAEAAYEKALADARATALGIAADARAEIQTQVDEAMARADAEIAERTAVSERRIAEIRQGAIAATREVAEETSAAIVEAIMPDAVAADALKAAVADRLGSG